MLNRESIIGILNTAHQIDSECELFGASRHQYKLNPPIRVSYVRDVEERYRFELPEECPRNPWMSVGLWVDYGGRTARAGV